MERQDDAAANVTGLIRASKGTVKFNGRDVTHVSAHEKAQMGLVLSPRSPALYRYDGS